MKDIDIPNYFGPNCLLKQFSNLMKGFCLILIDVYEKNEFSALSLLPSYFSWRKSRVHGTFMPAYTK